MQKTTYRKSKITHYDQYPELLQKYLNYKGTIENKSVNTVISYAFDLEEFLKFMVETKESTLRIEQENENETEIWQVNIEFLRTVSHEDIIRYLNYVGYDKGNSTNTRYRKTEAVRGFFKYLCEIEEMLDKNPAANISTPKISKSLPKYLTADESRRLLQSIDGSNAARDFCIILMFLTCGLRLSELVGIDIYDIRDYEVLFVRGKGSKERIVPLTPPCIEAIKNYMEVRNNTQKKIKTPEALFISPQTGCRLGRRRIQAIVENALKNAGLSGMGLSTHKLRHTAATLMHQNGADIKTIKDFLGHENLSTTEIYTHLDNEQLRDAAYRNPLSGIVISRKDGTK